MYQVKTSIIDLFDEEKEFERIESAFSDDPDLMSLIKDITELTLKNDFENAKGFCEFLGGHSDYNPLEYLHNTIFGVLYYIPGIVEFSPK